MILRRNRETDAQGQFTELAPDTGTAATTYTDDTVAAETPYTYRIKAINAHGTSERSRWFHIDTLAGPEPTPGAERLSRRASRRAIRTCPTITPPPAGSRSEARPRAPSEPTGDQDRFAVELVAGRTYQFDLTGSPGGGGTLPDTFFRAIYNSEGQYQADSYNDDFDGGRDSRVTFTANGERDVLRAGVGRPGRGRELHAERDRRDATVTGDGIALEVGVSRPMTTPSPARPAPWSSPGRASRGQQEKPAHEPVSKV